MTIILPTYNGGKFIRDQIESIQRQTFTGWKLLVRDDGSFDETLDIVNNLARYDSRIEVINNQCKNQGLRNNVKILLENVCSEYVMFADQDDVWFDLKAQKLVEAMYQQAYRYGDRQPLLVHADAFVVDQRLRGRRRMFGSYPKCRSIKKSFFNYYVQGASSIINRYLKDEILREIESAYIHDRLAHLISEFYGYRLYLNEPLMLYRQHSGNLIGKPSLSCRLMRSMKQVEKKFYLDQDRDLILKLGRGSKHKKLIQVYERITSAETHKTARLLLLISNRIPMRWIDILRLCIRG